MFGDDENSKKRLETSITNALLTVANKYKDDLKQVKPINQ